MLNEVASSAFIQHSAFDIQHYANPPEGLAADGAAIARRARRLHGRERLARHVLPRDARRRQRGADRAGQGSDRVRLGLPRGYLRDVRLSHQRRPARTGSGHDGLPAAHAALQGQRSHRPRAVARQGVSADQGPRRRSQRLRPHHPGRRLHVDQRRRRAGRQRHPHPRSGRRTGDGLGRLHRLRRVRRRLQECVSRALHVGEGQPPGAAAAGEGRARRAGRRDGRSPRSGRVWQLLERGRVRGGVPEGNLDHQHRADEPRSTFEATLSGPR